tara:strand:- start:150994 stop:151242 length:249 start_codon:yes stop_codon:yes gene_type:complete
MTSIERDLRKQERSAKIAIWMAGRSSRNKSLLDRICRFLVVKETTLSPEQDFLRDEFVDNDQGFDPDELDRYQRGEDIQPRN